MGWLRLFVNINWKPFNSHHYTAYHQESGRYSRPLSHSMDCEQPRCCYRGAQNTSRRHLAVWRSGTCQSNWIPPWWGQEPHQTIGAQTAPPPGISRLLKTLHHNILPLWPTLLRWQSKRLHSVGSGYWDAAPGFAEKYQLHVMLREKATAAWSSCQCPACNICTERAECVVGLHSGGTVTFHVTHTVITEEHLNHVNVCIRNTLILLQLIQFSSVSHVWFFATPWTAARQASLSITNSQSLVKLISIDLVMPSSHLILCHPLLRLPSIFPSIRVFSYESVLHIRWPKYWSFSISPSNEYSGLISFRIDWFDLLAVQGTLKSLLQHHSSKASILQHLAFFMVQLSHPYMITGKTITLTIQTFVGKVMSLLFSMRSLS